jgi:glycosyltransferase involved in cell wall biosynthesis
MRKNISVIIPVYNSQLIISTTVLKTLEFLREQNIFFEIIVVNDGSTDDSWEVLCALADKYKGDIKAINLLKNSGQHSAIMCGMYYSNGDWVVTLDDDMQIAPSEIGKLIEHAKNGVDVVVGKFKEKKHPIIRRIGSKVVQKLNEYIFQKPNEFSVSSFRMIRRDVVERILKWKTPFPYINGLMLLSSSKCINVLVEHHERSHGKSGYDFRKILSLTFRILFNYSAFPLRLVMVIALIASLVSFSIATFFIIRKLIGGTEILGWTSIISLVAFFNSFIVLMLAMIGEYLLRLVRQLSNETSYMVKEIYSPN